MQTWKPGKATVKGRQRSLVLQSNRGNVRIRHIISTQSQIHHQPAKSLPLGFAIVSKSRILIEVKNVKDLQCLRSRDSRALSVQVSTDPNYSRRDKRMPQIICRARSE